jgi:hypothetical protein
MSIDVEKFKKDLDEWVESDAGKAYFEKERKKNEIKLDRYKRFEKWLETHDINELMQRLIEEHGEAWHDKCYKRGYEPHPNNKLNFLIHYVTDNLAPVDIPQIQSEHFSNQSWFFKGYYINMTWGQGVLTQLFDNNFNQIIGL